jgi:hypothetical protein
MEVAAASSTGLTVQEHSLYLPFRSNIILVVSFVGSRSIQNSHIQTNSHDNTASLEVIGYSLVATGYQCSKYSRFPGEDQIS